MTSSPLPFSASAILFDMDGLLVDSEPLWLDVERDFVRARGGDFTDDLARACVGRGLLATLGIMEAQAGIAVDLEADPGHIVDAFIARVSALALKPGARELLEEAVAAGVPVALASSSARRLIAAVLAQLALTSHFGAVVSGDCVANLKPAPDIFLRAAKALGVAPDRCVVLEDSLAGATAGRAAGMHVIAVPEGDPARFAAFADVADAVVADLFEARRRIAFGAG